MQFLLRCLSNENLFYILNFKSGLMQKGILLILLFFTGTGILLAQNEAELLNQLKQAESLLNQKPKESLKIASQVNTAAEKGKLVKVQAKAIAITGVANYKIDEYTKAKALITQAELLSRQNYDTSVIAFSKYWLGNIELNQGQYSKALELYQNVLLLAQKAGDKENMARALDGKATIYEALGEDEKALELYNRSLTVAKEADFKEWYGNVTFELANQLYKKGKQDEAIKKYQEAIQLSEEAGNLNNKANCLQQLATIYYNRNEFKQAMNHVQQAMDIFQETGSMSSFSHARLLMCFVFIAEKQYDIAIELAKLSLQEGNENGEIELEKNSAEVLYYAYLYKGDKAKALHYHEIFHELSEKNHTQDVTKKATQIELQSNFEKERQLAKAVQDKKDAERTAEFEKQKLIKKASFVGIGLLAIIAALAIFAFSQKRSDTRLIAEEKRKSDELLLHILPADVIGELKAIRSETKSFDLATVMFGNIKIISATSERLSPELIAQETEYYFNQFNQIAARYRLEKVETSGDACLCLSALPQSDNDNAFDVISAALDMLQLAKQNQAERGKAANTVFELKIGIHTGPLIAGIVGLRKFSYDIWGDTVNIAARMEQYSEVGKINISAATYELVKGRISCTHHGKTDTRNKEQLDMYFVNGIS